MPKTAHGSTASTTVIITRLTSMASRTWGDPRVTSPGMYMKVSIAS